VVYYRRNLLKGGTYFFTLALQNRKTKYLIDHIDSLRIAMKKTRQKMPYTTIAIVILPEHLHAIWELPENDKNYPTRLRLMKSYFTQSLIKNDVALKNNNRGRYNIWQERYWEHTIRDEDDLEAHVNYIHYNPVKHGLVQRTADWPYSSFHSYVKKKILSPHWGENVPFPQINFGE
jgi:putative transposase